MPLRNRCLPTGEIVVDPARGTLTGNRGCLVGGSGALTRRWTTRAWIACELAWKGLRQPLADPRRWTPLFFLDEAVALAAGHRPCATCRRADYTRFADAWAKPGCPRPKASEMDMALHTARTGPRALRSAADLPNGAFILHEGRAALVHAGRLHPFRPDGYESAWTLPGHPVEVLTPAPVVTVLATGYRPRLHPGLDA